MDASQIAFCPSYQLLSSGEWRIGIQQIARGSQYFKGRYARLLALEEWQWSSWQQAYTHAKDPATSTAVGADPGVENSREIPVADVEMKLPQALKKKKKINPQIHLSPAKIWLGVSIPLLFPGQTILLDFTINSLRASAQAQNLTKCSFFDSFPTHGKGRFCISGRHSWQTLVAANSGKAYRAMFFHPLWKYPLVSLAQGCTNSLTPSLARSSSELWIICCWSQDLHS